MITYHINRFIHSVIRENKLIHIMELLVSKSKEKDVLLNDLTSELKKFLKQENELLFDDNKLKYLIFLENFKENIDNIEDLKDKNRIDNNSLLFRLYEIPKKRNNLLIVFLIYFYIKNKNRFELGGKEILRIIYIYFMIIIYRNRLDKDARENLLAIEKKQFYSVGEIINNKIKALSRRYKHINFQLIKRSILLSLVLILGAFSYLNFSPNLLKADITDVSKNGALGKVAFDSIMIGRVSDPILNSIKDIGFQNILLILVFALLVQSLKTSLSTVFFNNLLTKVFHFLWLIIKFISRIFFYIYDYITYKLETRYIFSVLNIFIKKQILPGGFLLTIFGLFYGIIYFAVVYLYIFAIAYLFNYANYYLYIILASIIISLMVIYFNLLSDINNFKTFILEIENIIKDIFEKEKDTKKSV